MRVLVDLNVVLDVLENREPHFLDSVKVWTAIDKGNVTGYLAAHSITTLFYIMRQRIGTEQAAQLLTNTLNIFSVAPVDEKVIRQAISLHWDDFEDAVQMCAAAQVGADYLITRNVKDFKDGNVPVIMPTAFGSLLKGD
ncbi:MAG: PIN domain-containing protein [Ardenticatenaceae bacterium]|nr:PIN domain-containing protein [Ardenticatenaceae bacterium]